MVVLEVGSLAKGAAQRYPVYTTAKANVAALTSGLSATSCAMADDVLVEARHQCRYAATGSGPARSASTARSAGRIRSGFTPNGVSDTLEPRRTRHRQPRHW